MKGMQLSLEEFEWRTRWLEIARLSEYVSPFYTLKAIRRLKREAKLNESGLLRNGRRTEWTGMVENWYEHYKSEGLT